MRKSNQQSIKSEIEDETVQSPSSNEYQKENDIQRRNVNKVATAIVKKSEKEIKTIKIERQITPQELILDVAKNPSKYFDNEHTMHTRRIMGRPKVSEEDRKNNKVMMSFTDADYEEIQRYKKILNKATITSTLEEFIKIGMEVKRKELLFELGVLSQDDASEERGKGF